jgi:hypothetical protein
LVSRTMGQKFFFLFVPFSPFCYHTAFDLWTFGFWFFRRSCLPQGTLCVDAYIVLLPKMQAQFWRLLWGLFTPFLCEVDDAGVHTTEGGVASEPPAVMKSLTVGIATTMLRFVSSAIYLDSFAQWVILRAKSQSCSLFWRSLRLRSVCLEPFL